jgi:hypothetical protein
MSGCVTFSCWANLDSHSMPRGPGIHTRIAPPTRGSGRRLVDAHEKMWNPTNASAPALKRFQVPGYYSAPLSAECDLIAERRNRDDSRSERSLRDACLHPCPSVDTITRNRGRRPAVQRFRDDLFMAGPGRQCKPTLQAVDCPRGNVQTHRELRTRRCVDNRSVKGRDE